VQVDDAGVLDQRLCLPAERARQVRADLHRAQVRFPVHDVEPGRAAEQREKVARVVGVHREVPGAGVQPGEDGRHRVRRPLADGGVAREPGGASREAGERGEPHCVDSLLRVEQRVQRQLVEDDQHHWNPRPLVRRVGRGRSGEGQLGRVRVEEEEREEEHGRRCERRDDHPGSPEPRVDGSRCCSRCRREDDEQPPGRAEGADRLQDEETDERRDEDVVHDRPSPPGHHGFDREQHSRGDEHEREREEDDVPARRAARAEELGVLAEQVEQRLGERERGEHEQVQPRDAQAHYEARSRRRPSRRLRSLLSSVELTLN